MAHWSAEFERFLGRCEVREQLVDQRQVPPHRVFSIDNDIGRKVDFKRLAIHHLVLPPHCRTSFPHGESLEEEFVFVLAGNPHLWINGYLCRLDEGHAVGFPSGTGIAHTFINHSAINVQLLVVGEKTKKDNKCVYPVNPEIKAGCQFWWEDAPVHPLGPHPGVPGPHSPQDQVVSVPGCVTHCPSQPRGSTFHYPGDSETFGDGFRISDKVGLNALGIWYQRLAPGKRSAFPHAHSHEEEFVYALKGRPTIWMDGFAKDLDAGAFAAFPPNTGINHVVINNTDEEVIYICVGEAQDFPDEKLTYPLNKLRQAECLRKGWYWVDAPQRILGAASAIPSAGFLDHLEFEICDQSSAADVFDVYQKAQRYFQRVDNCTPSIEMALKAIADGPAERSEKYFKEFLLIKHNGRSVGCLDLHANHPNEGSCYLGLLLLSDDISGRGMGRRCYELAQDYIKRALGCKKILLGVSESNDVAGFWQRMGLSRNGKSYTRAGEFNTTTICEYQKEI